MLVLAEKGWGTGPYVGDDFLLEVLGKLHDLGE